MKTSGAMILAACIAAGCVTDPPNGAETLRGTPDAVVLAVLRSIDQEGIRFGPERTLDLLVGRLSASLAWYGAELTALGYAAAPPEDSPFIGAILIDFETVSRTGRASYRVEVTGRAKLDLVDGTANHEAV